MRVQGRDIRIMRPLINLSKAMIVKEAKRRGVPIEKTVSCYINGGCGECNACKLRASALSELAPAWVDSDADPQRESKEM